MCLCLSRGVAHWVLMSEHDDADRYRKEKKERLRRMSVAELVNELAVAPSDPNQPKIDVSHWSDQQLIEGVA
jgi:hypothetical protein